LKNPDGKDGEPWVYKVIVDEDNGKILFAANEDSKEDRGEEKPFKEGPASEFLAKYGKGRKYVKSSTKTLM